MGQPRYRVFLLGQVVVFFAISAAAQQLPVRFQRISIEQGLSQNSIFCMAQDEKGFIWIGTETGLNRYDGYSFISYFSAADDPRSLSNSYILALCRDRRNRLWIGTDRGLNRFNPEENNFTRFLHDPANSDSLWHDRINVICEDREGILWIGTNEGVNRLDPQTGGMTRVMPGDVTAGERAGPRFPVQAIIQDAAGVLWIGTDGGGLCGFDPLRRSWKRYRHHPDIPGSLSDNGVLALHEDRQKVLWVGTRNGGLCSFDPAGQKFTSYRRDPRDPFSLSGNQVQAIHEDRHGTLWVGTWDSGLDYFDRQRQKFYHYLNNPNITTSISGNRILSIFEDQSSILWFGTYGAGGNKFNREGNKFIAFTPDSNNPDSLSYNHIRPIYEDREKILWIGTDGGGLNRLDRTVQRFTHFRYQSQDDTSLSSDRVFAIQEDLAGRLWVATMGGGLNRFDRKTRTFSRYRYVEGDAATISSDNIRVICRDHRGLFWIGTDGGGFCRFDPATGQAKRYRNQAGNVNSLSHDRIFCITEDRSRYLWIGTFGGGLNRFDPERETFVRYQEDPENPAGLRDNYVLSVYEDGPGNIWIGTLSGLFRLDRKSGRCMYFTEKNGLPNNIIYSILEDEDGNLWLASNRGLARYHPGKGTFKKYDVNDGLQSNEFNTHSAYKSSSGEMFFGGINGFNSFFPRQIRDNPYQPPVAISGFSLFNREVPVGTMEDGRVILRRPIYETGDLELSYRDNVLSFEYTALHFAAPEKNQYAYRLEGLDHAWNLVGNRRYVSFAGLPPGDYVLRVKGSNNDGVWNETGAALRIRIHPPFWRTWWFFLLAGVVMVCAVVTVFRLRVRQLRVRQRELEELVARRTMELKEASLKDPLTGLRNRRFISEVLSDDIRAFVSYKCYLTGHGANRRVHTDHSVMGVFLFDIDHFKMVNDEFGHDAGDRVLVEFAGLLRKSVRSDDVVVRFGGEEFLVILKNTNPDYLDQYAARVRGMIDSHEFQAGGRVIRKTSSIGYVQFPFYPPEPQLISFENAVSLADLGLYYAKNHGRDQAVKILPGETLPAGESAERFARLLEHGLQSEYLKIQPLPQQAAS